jgi:flagellar biosynthetic protein FliQ
MTWMDAVELMQSAIWVVLIASGPAVLGATLVGVIIALFQALTQVQEMTLTFVPKIVVVLVLLAFTAPFIGSQILRLTAETYGRIERIN